MPRSRLEGREPAETTDHEYDDDGRLVRSVTTREPLWLELDVAEIEALAEYRSGLCQFCGRPIEDCKAASERNGATFDVQRRGCSAQLALLEAQNAVAEAETDRGKKPPPLSAGARAWSMSVHMPKRKG